MHKDPELHYVMQGDIYIAKKPLIFKTTLGSCVSVCLWDPHKRIGGMNHYTRPLCNDSNAPRSMCGEYAIEALIDVFLSKGSRKSDLRAGVFGGGNLLNIETDGLRVGPTNIDIAFKVLEAHGIPVIKSDISHTHGLNVYFNSSNGTIRVESVQNSQVAEKKQKAPSDYLQSIEDLRNNFNKSFKGNDYDI